jgi:hypothetical protein
MIDGAGLRRVGAAVVVAVSVIAAAASRAGAQPVDCNQLPAGITDCVRDADCLC